MSVRDAAAVRRADSTGRLRMSPEHRAKQAAAGAVGAQRPGGAEDAGARPAAAAAARPEGAWHYAKHVSAHLSEAADTRQTRRHVRYAQRQVLWGVSSLERVRKCGRVTHSGTGHVVVRNNSGVSHYAGLTTCGSIWACPCCSANIRNTRATEISEATARWDRAGNEVYMVTFTAPHTLGDRLKPLLGTIAEGFRAVISGRRWTSLKKRLGIVGQIRSAEVTHGKNGWHPHLHVLVYVEGGLDAQGLADLTVYLRDRWRSFIVGAGHRPPSVRHGVDVQRCTSAAEAGQYIAKTQDGRAVGNEMARGDLKQGRRGGRTPFEILDDFRWTGDVADLALWQEYEQATKGRQCITWSAGLRQLLGAVDDRTDEEIAAEEIGGDDVAVLEHHTWTAVAVVPGLPAAVLDASEHGGLTAINELLARHGIPQAWSPDSGFTM